MLQAWTNVSVHKQLFRAIINMPFHAVINFASSFGQRFTPNPNTLLNALPYFENDMTPRRSNQPVAEHSYRSQLSEALCR